MNTYSPKPIDTDAVVLPPDLEKLQERLAENVHDLWAKERIAQGWTLGPRSDEKKTNPCLVSYADLPENERVYDRNTAMQTLKAIIALGYRIEPAKES